MSEIAESLPLYKKVFDALIDHEFLPITREGIIVKIKTFRADYFVDCKIQIGCGKIKIVMPDKLSATFQNVDGYAKELDREAVRFIEQWKDNSQTFKTILDHMKIDEIRYTGGVNGIQINENKISIMNETYGADDDVFFTAEFDETESIALLEMIIELMEEWVGVVDNAIHNKGRKIKAAR